MKLPLIIATVVVALVATEFVHFRSSLKKIQETPVTLPASMVAEGKPALRIVVVSESAYSVKGKQLDLEGVRKILKPNGVPVSSVVVLKSGKPGFGATILLLEAIRAAGIEKINIETATTR